MKTTFSTRLRAALDRADIPPHIQREVFNAAINTQKNTTVYADAQWDALRASARHARTMVRTNRSKWTPGLITYYEEYVDMLSTVLDRIEQARMMLGPDNLPITLDAFTQMCATHNAQRIREGKPPGAECTARWQTWIPESRRVKFTRKVEAYYDALGDAVRGTRFVPFMTREIRAESRVRLERLTTTIKTVRRTMANCGMAPPMADTPYAALQLAACRQAEIALERLKKRPITLAEPVPVNWLHLLEPSMRQRLRESAAAPELTSTVGLQGFLSNDPPARDAAGPAEMEALTREEHADENGKDM